MPGACYSHRMYRLIAALLVAAVAMFAGNITGTWEFAVETSQGSGNPTFTFKQDGEKLTGTYSGRLGKADVTGTLKGEKVEFQFNVSRDGQSSTVRYWGTLEGATKMKGDAEYGELGKATWTASKK